MPAPRRRPERERHMGREEPLRISCDDCPGGSECRDCLVEFFLGERNARVVRLGNDPVVPTPDLDPDLQAPSQRPPPRAPPLATPPSSPPPARAPAPQPPSTPSPPMASSPGSWPTATTTAAP